MTRNQLAILQRIFHRECRSLAQYLGDSWLWTDRGAREDHELVRSIVADERRWAQQLAEIIDQRGGVPFAGNYPAEFTNHNLHYLALDFMRGQLADYLEGNLAAVQHDLAAVADDPPVQSLLEQMLERKRGQIEALRKLAGAAAKV